MLRFFKMIFKYKACWKYPTCSQNVFNYDDPLCKKKACIYVRYAEDFSFIRDIYRK